MTAVLNETCLGGSRGVSPSAGFVSADDIDKKTVITTNEAMQLPILCCNRGPMWLSCNILQIKIEMPSSFFDKDENLITTVIAIPNLRLRRTGKGVFAFWEVPAGQPKALRAWFYPGEEFGQEFAYPKGEAVSITANNTGATVPTYGETYDFQC